MNTAAKHVTKAGHGAMDSPAAHYRNLMLMAVLSFGAMYGLMYAMVDRIGNVHHSLNQVYMAGLMAAPMVLLELVLMRGMYADRKRNLVLGAASVVVFAVCWTGIRTQAGISDRQFLRSMIPHHAGALLMCEEASLHDPEIKALCERIKASQQSEIDWMQAKLDALER